MENNMEGDNKCGSCGKCSQNYFLRWILGVVILLIVLSLGMKIGEFKGFVEAGGWSGSSRYGAGSCFGGGRMMGSYYQWNGAGNGSPVVPDVNPNQ